MPPPAACKAAASPCAATTYTQMTGAPSTGDTTFVPSASSLPRDARCAASMALMPNSMPIGKQAAAIGTDTGPSPYGPADWGVSICSASGAGPPKTVAPYTVVSIAPPRGTPHWGVRRWPGTLGYQASVGCLTPAQQSRLQEATDAAAAASLAAATAILPLAPALAYEPHMVPPPVQLPDGTTLYAGETTVIAQEPLIDLQLPPLAPTALRGTAAANVAQLPPRCHTTRRPCSASRPARS